MPIETVNEVIMNKILVSNAGNSSATPLRLY
jgi:hypothetical protein